MCPTPRRASSPRPCATAPRPRSRTLTRAASGARTLTSASVCAKYAPPPPLLFFSRLQLLYLLDVLNLGDPAGQPCEYDGGTELKRSLACGLGNGIKAGWLLLGSL